MDRYKCYKTLGVEQGASLEHIKKAYRSLVKEYHPDITRDHRTGAYFDKISDAYKHLVVMEKKRRFIDFPVRDNPKWKSQPPKEVDIYSLGKILVTAKAPEMRAFAAGRLGNSGKKSAYAYLRRALQDHSEAVVLSAVKAVGQLQITQSAGELSLLFYKSSKKVKLVILESVEQISLKGSFRNILTSGMQDPDYEVRTKALSLFAKRS